MGCETLDRHRRRSRDADVVYVLRMQRERMRRRGVRPVLREYTARWGVTPERVRPGQMVMHPGPMNRGVEIDPRVADSADVARSPTQVRSGLVVRMAVLYDLLDRRARVARARQRRRWRDALLPQRPLATASSLAGRVLDPAQGIDVAFAVTVDDGVIAAIEPGRGARRARARAGVRRPARPPAHAGPRGRGDDRARAPRPRRPAATARSSRCRTPTRSSTRPPCSARSSRRRAREARRARPASWPRSRRAQRGEELTEMAELADAGAAAFTDDGRPVVSAGLMRRALQYSARHRAARSRSTARSRRSRATARCTRAPSPPSSASAAGRRVAESVMVERDLALAGYEQRPLHLMHLSARESVDALRHAHARGRRGDRRGDAAPPRPHRRGRPLARPEREDEPAAARRGRPRRRCVDALRDGTIACVATDHAPHARHEKDVAVRGGAVRRHRPRDGVRRALHPPRRAGRRSRSRRCSSGCPAGPARALGLAEPRIEVGARANLVLLDLDAEWTVTEDGFRSRSANSWLLGRDAARRGREDGRRRPGGVRA